MLPCLNPLRVSLLIVIRIELKCLLMVLHSSGLLPTFLISDSLFRHRVNKTTVLLVRNLTWLRIKRSLVQLQHLMEFSGSYDPHWPFFQFLNSSALFLPLDFAFFPLMEMFFPQTFYMAELLFTCDISTLFVPLHRDLS